MKTLNKQTTGLLMVVVGAIVVAAMAEPAAAWGRPRWGMPSFGRRAWQPFSSSPLFPSPSSSSFWDFPSVFAPRPAKRYAPAMTSAAAAEEVAVPPYDEAAEAMYLAPDDDDDEAGHFLHNGDGEALAGGCHSSRHRQWTVVPATDIVEDDAGFVLYVDLPGAVEPQLDFQYDTLTLKAAVEDPHASFSWPSAATSAAAALSDRIVVEQDVEDDLLHDPEADDAAASTTATFPRWALHERPSSVFSYERSFQLSRDLDAENISAVYRNGVLQVAIPKGAGAKPQSIPIITISA